jgi:glyoxylase-like metal-dependent hydrolase (beta-lactamase superfamily II)
MNQPVTQIILGGFTNAFVLRGDTGCILVDAGPPGRTKPILDHMTAHHSAPQGVRLIPIAHGHTDHFGGAAVLRKRTGAPVAIHALDAEAMRRGIHQPGSLRPTSRLVGMMMGVSWLPTRVVPGRALAPEPDIVLETTSRLDRYGVKGEVIHTPGHTPGAVSVLLDTGQAVVGDMLMGQLAGALPGPGHPIAARDGARNTESIRQLLTRSPRFIYTGHGRPCEPKAVSRLV